MKSVALGFSLEAMSVPIANLLPSRKIPEGLDVSKKYKQIRSSIEEVGLIEPLSITPEIQQSGNHMVLDGHVRMIALRELGHAEVPCLVSKDDEGYTYNSRINRLSTIQEHYMIRRAIERGVSAERLAKALSMDVSHVNKKMRLLDGICPEAQELLRDRQFSPELSRFLRQMKPTRQVECIELMLSANNLTVAYVEAMLIATPAEMLVEGKKLRKASGGVTQEQMAKMEREMANLQGQYKMVEESYGQDVLNLVLARGFLIRLLENTAVARYLKQRQPDVVKEFEAIVKTVALDQS